MVDKSCEVSTAQFNGLSYINVVAKEILSEVGVALFEAEAGVWARTLRSRRWAMLKTLMLALVFLLVLAVL